MGNNYRRQVEVVMSPDEAIHRLYGALSAVPGASDPRVNGAWVTTTVGTSFASWGETAQATCSPVRAGAC